MSSPLSILKKTKRVPLPQIQKDGKKRTCNKRSTIGYDDNLYTEMFPSNKQHSDRLSFAAMSEVKEELRNLDLISSMMKEICHLEEKLKAQAKDIECKTRRIEVLEEQLTLFQETKESGFRHDTELFEMCLRLQKQVMDMKGFLNDYGLIWIGDDEDVLHWNPSSESSGQSAFELNFDLVIHNIQELNVEAGEGESLVTSVPGGAKLTQRSSISLELYKNGIVVFNGPFCSYDDPTTQEFMQDLMDGFYPSQIEEAFPNGVPFQVYDKRHEEFIDHRLWMEFPGIGQTIDGSRVLPTSVTDPKLSRNQSMEQFFRKLPETARNASLVIDSQGSLKTQLPVTKSIPATLVETSALQALRNSKTDSPASVKTVTLRVKSEDGVENYILQMFLTETIRDLRRYLDMQRGRRDYDIICGFPQLQCYSDDTQTLVSCGLWSNTTLLLRPPARAHPGVSHKATQN